MRGDDFNQEDIFSYISPEKRVPKDHPLEPPPDDPGNPTVDFTGQKRSNQTHASTTDPDARLSFATAVYNLVRIRNLAAETG